MSRVAFAIEPEADKITRAAAQSAVLEAGLVYLPQKSGLADRIPQRSRAGLFWSSRRPSRQHEAVPQMGEHLGNLGHAPGNRVANLGNSPPTREPA